MTIYIMFVFLFLYRRLLSINDVVGSWNRLW